MPIPFFRFLFCDMFAASSVNSLSYVLCELSPIACADPHWFLAFSDRYLLRWSYGISSRSHGELLDCRCRSKSRMALYSR